MAAGTPLTADVADDTSIGPWAFVAVHVPPGGTITAEMWGELTFDAHADRLCGFLREVAAQAPR